MQKKATYEFLRDAYAILDGVPSAAIAFGPACSQKGESLDKGTVCSPEGWLAQHPVFVALGLALSDDGKSVTCGKETGASALAEVFEVTLKEAAELFGEKLSTEAEAGISDKLIWQHRVRKFLTEKSTAEREVQEASVEAQAAEPQQA